MVRAALTVKDSGGVPTLTVRTTVVVASPHRSVGSCPALLNSHCAAHLRWHVLRVGARIENARSGGFVLVPDVRAISVGLALICELADRRCFSVPLHLIGPRSQVGHTGDAGTLEVVDGSRAIRKLPTVDGE